MSRSSSSDDDDNTNSNDDDDDDYENITLTSYYDDISVVIYLPPYSIITTTTDHDTNEHSDRIHNDNNKDKKYYYYGSRFDHSSMIGNIITRPRRRKNRGDDNQSTKRTKKKNSINEKDQQLLKEHEHEQVQQQHEFYTSEMWRSSPHNPYWPESGIGMAAEYGVGDIGDTCTVKCGYYTVNSNIINGVLGYNNEYDHNQCLYTDTNNMNHNHYHCNTFLKIGVGELIKHSCPLCHRSSSSSSSSNNNNNNNNNNDSNEEYQFNSPYILASNPYWYIQIVHVPMTITENENITIMVQKVIMDHNATIRDGLYGYHIHKEIYIDPSTSSIIVTNQLYNIGSSSSNDDNSNHPNTFSTVWYSHNFFTCDYIPLGPEYEMEFNTREKEETNVNEQQQQNQQQQQQQSLLYDEPGTWSWSTPIMNYATIESITNNDMLYDNTTTTTTTSSTSNSMIQIQFQQPIESGIRIKAEFKKELFLQQQQEQNNENNNNNEQQSSNDSNMAGYTIHACNSIVQSKLSWPEQYNIQPEQIIQLQQQQQVEEGDANNNKQQEQQVQPSISLYAYNVYVEESTLSPEPQLLLSNIQSGSYVEWTQTYTITSNFDSENDDNYNEEEVDIVTPVITNIDTTATTILSEASMEQSISTTTTTISTSFLSSFLWLTNLLPGYKEEHKTLFGTTTKAILTIESNNSTNKSFVPILLINENNMNGINAPFLVSILSVIGILFIILTTTIRPYYYHHQHRDRRRRQMLYEEIA